MHRRAARGSSSRRWLQWLWPLALLLLAWVIAPLRAGASYPGMPCTAQADTVFSLASYTVLFIPAAVVLLLLSRRLIPGALRRGLRAWAAGFVALSIAVVVVYLAFAGISADRRPFRTSEQTVACPRLGAGLQALHCWRDGSTIEMNAYGQRPLNVDGVQTMAWGAGASWAVDTGEFWGATIYEGWGATQTLGVAMCTCETSSASPTLLNR